LLVEAALVLAHHDRGALANSILKSANRSATRRRYSLLLDKPLVVAWRMLLTSSFKENLQDKELRVPHGARGTFLNHPLTHFPSRGSWVRIYTYSAPDHEVVLINARLAVVGRLASPLVEPVLEPRAAQTASSRHRLLGSRAPGASALRPGITETPVVRRIYLNGWRDVPVHQWEDLDAGAVIDGFAIVESEATTVLARGGERVRVTPHGWLDLTVSMQDGNLG
jgi:hypothetical protein